jgi:hypothetical protein
MKTTIKVLVAFFAPLAVVAYAICLYNLVGLFVPKPSVQLVLSLLLFVTQAASVFGMGEAGFFESVSKDKREIEQ